MRRPWWLHPDVLLDVAFDFIVAFVVYLFLEDLALRLKRTGLEKPPPPPPPS